MRFAISLFGACNKIPWQRLRMLVGYNFTESFTVDVAKKISETFKTISTAISLGEFINQLLLKVYSLQEKNTGHLTF